MRRLRTLGVLLLVACGDGTPDADPSGPSEAASESSPGPAPRSAASRERAHASEAVRAARSGESSGGSTRESGTDEPTGAPAADELLTPATLAAALRAVGAIDGDRKAAAVGLVQRIESDPALVLAAARLLADTQDEAVLATFRDGLAGRFIGAEWRPAREDLVRAAETPGPSARRIAAFHALGWCEGFRTTTGGGSDPVVRAAVFRQLAAESDPEVAFAAAMCLGYGRLSDDERAVVVGAVRRIVVPHERGTPAAHPVRIARRVLYEDLGSDALLRDDWSVMLESLDGAATQNERDDVTAGFVLACDYLRAPRVAATDPKERAAALAHRGETIERFYRAAEDLAARRRIVGTIVRGEGLLTTAASAPEDERRAAAEVLTRLAEFETDPETLGILRGTGLVEEWESR